MIRALFLASLVGVAAVVPAALSAKLTRKHEREMCDAVLTEAAERTAYAENAAEECQRDEADSHEDAVQCIQAALECVAEYKKCEACKR